MTPAQIIATPAQARGNRKAIPPQLRKKQSPVKEKKRKRGEHRSVLVSNLPPEQQRELGVVEGGEETFLAAQRREKIAMANERELKVQIQRGEVAPTTQLKNWYGGGIIAARNALLRIPGEARDRLAAETDPGKCEQILLLEIERVLEMLAKYDRPLDQPANQAKEEVA